jgi:cell division protein ZapE
MLKSYNQLIESGQLRPDDAQEDVAKLLASLAAELVHYTERRGGFLAKLMRGSGLQPQGLFIVGRVGRGKTMLMNLFYEHVPIKQKKRVHFHEFMQNVHKEIHTFRKLGAGEPVEQVAHALAKDLLLLCFDEFEVTDVTDAMILSKLFGAMMEEGVVLVFTSNKVPLDHYKTGLQRGSYVEFCEKLEKSVKIAPLDSEQDYRETFAAGEHENFFTPLGYKAEARLHERFKTLGGESLSKYKLDVNGRIIELESSGKIAWASFEELCAKPLGAGDYLEIAKNFGALFLHDVPQMKAESRNEARRFVTLVDILYENKILLVMTAEVEPSKLYISGTGDFEFKRTVSRLTEMRSW